jgi:hypothetical protein
MMMRKAVVFTSYNRSDYLQETLRSWRDVANKNGYDFFFKLEPSSMQKKMENKMINFLSEQKLHGDVINNPERKGVLLNPWEGLNTMFEQGYDFVVLAEDDIEVSDDILHFFDELSHRHERDEEVLAICASNLWSIEVDNADHTTYFKRSYFSPLIWGTWKDRWTNYLRDTWDKDYSSGGAENSGWDWNIALRIIPENNLKCIFPEKSRSKHIGKRGVHMREEDYHASVAQSFSHHNNYLGYKEIPSDW